MKIKSILASIVVTIISIAAATAYGKDDDYAPAHFITSVTNQTFHQEVSDSQKPVVLDVCAPADCAARIAATERLAVQFTGRARFVQAPTAENSALMQRVNSPGLVIPTYMVSINDELFIVRKNLTEAEAKSFIESVISP
ncbi:MAG: hypothetical protein U0103_17155 [Candidatus Obscuribacterales bacterium]